MLQLIQVIGVLAILAASTLAQFALLGQQSLPYLGLSLGGATVLAVLAYLERQWGSSCSRASGHWYRPGRCEDGSSDLA